MSTPTYQLTEDLLDNLTASVTAATQTYTLGNLGGGLTYSNTAITNNGAIGPFTVSGINNPNTSPYTFSAGTNTAPWYSNTTSSKIRLDGTDADIEINGISLLKTMQEIQSRLNILQPNTALEKEWEELFELGKKYRALEQHIKEKQATWDKLKAMPPPEID
jgi:archaellum component FlaG (FlaF/FlaG flagellin family)